MASKFRVEKEILDSKLGKKKSIFMRVRTGHFCFCLINDRLRERKKYKGPVKGKLEMGIKHWNLLL